MSGTVNVSPVSIQSPRIQSTPVERSQESNLSSFFAQNVFNWTPDLWNNTIEAGKENKYAKAVLQGLVCVVVAIPKTAICLIGYSLCAFLLLLSLPFSCCSCPRGGTRQEELNNQLLSLMQSTDKNPKYEVNTRYDATFSSICLNKASLMIRMAERRAAKRGAKNNGPIILAHLKKLYEAEKTSMSQYIQTNWPSMQTAKGKTVKQVEDNLLLRLDQAFAELILGDIKHYAKDPNFNMNDFLAGVNARLEEFSFVTGGRAALKRHLDTCVKDVLADINDKTKKLNAIIAKSTESNKKPDIQDIDLSERSIPLLERRDTSRELNADISDSPDDADINGLSLDEPMILKRSSYSSTTLQPIALRFENQNGEWIHIQNLLKQLPPESFAIKPQPTIALPPVSLEPSQEDMNAAQLGIKALAELNPESNVNEELMRHLRVVLENPSLIAPQGSSSVGIGLGNRSESNSGVTVL